METSSFKIFDIRIWAKYSWKSVFSSCIHSIRNKLDTGDSWYPIKVSDKNFQPTIIKKKKGRQKRSLWNRWNRYVFRIFIEALSSMGYPMDFKKRQKNRDSNAEKITRIPVTAREREKKTQLAIYFFCPLIREKWNFPWSLEDSPNVKGGIGRGVRHHGNDRSG